MISSAVLIAVFAFSANTSPHRRHPGGRKRGHAPTSRAFIGPASNNNIGYTRGVSLASSSSTDDGSIEYDIDNNVKDQSSLISKSRLSSAAAPPKNRESASKIEIDNTRNNASTATSTTAKATKIIDTTSFQQTNTIYDVDKSTESSTIIQGLLPNKSFNLLCRIHCTITLLRKHFPTLLELPALSSSTARYIYDTNVTITGPKNETLAEGSDEVLLLNRALATAAVAARRAGSLLDLAVLGTTTSSSSTTTKQGQVVECELLIDPTNPLKVLVLWRTRLPSILSSTTSLLIGNQGNSRRKDSPLQSSTTSTTYTEFSGKSTLDISSDTGLVSKLQINEVKINGVVIIESLGTALAAVRRAARSAMASSIFDDTSNAQRRSSGNPLLDGLLNGLQDVVDAVDALPSSDEKDGSLSDSPLYVVPQHLWDEANFAVEEGISSSNSTTDTAGDIADRNIASNYIPIAIDQYSESRNVPLSGSEAFVGYATSHSALQNFAEYGLPQLSGVSASNSDLVEVSTETIRSLFATDAELVTADKNEQLTLLRGAGKIADLYRSLALLREASPGATDFGIKRIEADFQTRRLIVHWKTESPLKVEGTDVFVFEAPSKSSCRLPLGSDGDKEEVAKLCDSYFDKQRDGIPLKIKRVENLELKVAGVNADSAWAQSFVSAALRSGIAENTPLPDATIQELLRALTTKKKTATKKAKKDTQDSTMPSLDDTAALSFYNIIRALHNNLPNIVSTSKSSSSIIPAGEYLAETVELRGLLGEVLVRGDQSYRRLLGVAISSLRAAIQTNTVRLAATPKPTVEVTSDGKIKVHLVLALWVTPKLPLGKGSMGQSQDSNQGFGVPLKIEITSEYIVDETGRIRDHIIVESRLNGVLTPGDSFAKWIKGLTREEDEGSSSRVIPSAFDSLMDAMAWVRSMQADIK